MDNKLKLKEEIELQFLTVMLNEPDSITNLAEKIKVEDLQPDNQEVFSQFVQRAGKDSIDIMLEVSKLNIPGWSISELSSLQERSITSVCTYSKLIYNHTFEHFYDLVFSLKGEAFLKQSLDKIKSDFAGLDTLSDLNSEIEALLNKANNFKPEQSFSEKIDDIYEEIEKEMNSKNETSYTVSNIPSFNSSMGGAKLTNLIGIAGSYKSGKTTLSLNIISDFAKQGIPCGFFSLELSEKECNDKVLGIMAGVPYERIREPKKLTEDDKRKLYEYRSSKIKSTPLYVATKVFNEIDIRNKCQYWRDRFGVKIVCIDYLGYIKSRKRFDSREREMSYYSGFLKQMALELNLVVIVLAQLNRTGKTNPGTENLAESIALARDCDFLFVTYNPLECGIKSSNGIPFTESNFIVKLDTTRHSKHKKQFLLQMNDDGNMVEIASEYDNSFMKKTNSSLIPEELRNYITEDN